MHWSIPIEVYVLASFDKFIYPWDNDQSHDIEHFHHCKMFPFTPAYEIPQILSLK